MRTYDVTKGPPEGKQLQEVHQFLRMGNVFVYPTDTIYGIGCDATNEEAVQKIRHMKHRTTNPFSIIPPSLEWVRTNCSVPPEMKPWVEKLPGPYTLILPLKNPHCVAPSVCMGNASIGIRIPHHWIKDVVASLGTPIITTSVNIAGEKPLVDIQGLHPTMVDQLACALDTGPIEGSPSTLVLWDGQAVVIKKR